MGHYECRFDECTCRRERFHTPNAPLEPRYGECDYCGVKGCFPLRHNGLENDAQALRLARIMAKDRTETPRANNLAEWVVANFKRLKR